MDVVINPSVFIYPMMQRDRSYIIFFWFYRPFFQYILNNFWGDNLNKKKEDMKLIHKKNKGKYSIIVHYIIVKKLKILFFLLYLLIYNNHINCKIKKKPILISKHPSIILLLKTIRTCKVQFIEIVVISNSLNGEFRLIESAQVKIIFLICCFFFLISIWKILQFI